MSKLDLLLSEDASASLLSTALFDYPNVHHEAGREVVTAIRVQAPEVATDDTRTPLNLVAVVDVSGSMHGEKLSYAKDSLATMSNLLGADDTLTIITFSTRVKTVLDRVKMTGTGKANALQVISRLSTEGSTNFVGALTQAVSSMKASARPNMVNRIIMFTDGQADGGALSERQCLDIMDSQVTGAAFGISCFGYGQGVNAELLEEMARRGGGGYYFIENNDQCGSIFGTELGGLLSVYAQEIKVSINLTDGVQFVKWLDDAYISDGTTITIPNIFAGETKYVLARLKLPVVGKGVCARPTRIYTAVVTHTNMQTCTSHTDHVVGQIRYVRKATDATTDPTPEVQDQVAILDVAGTLQQARMLADLGDLMAAQNMLRDAQTRMRGATNSVYANNLATSLDGMMSSLQDQASYRASRQSLGNASYALRSRRGSGSDVDSMFLNEAQSATIRAFVPPQSDSKDTSRD